MRTNRILSLSWREHPAAPVLALTPGMFAMYTYSQLVLGNELLHLPGNVERYFPLLLVAPAALTIGIGLLRRQPWARKPASGILGGYVLLGWSVAGMAWSVLLNADPDASLPLAVGMTGLAGAGAVFAYFLYRPLFRRLSILPVHIQPQPRPALSRRP